MEGQFNGGFFALPVWGAYIWRGLYMEGLIFGILRYVKINRCRQLALDGLEDTDVDYTSNVAGSSPTYTTYCFLPCSFLS